jgi:hypothetical protein
MDTFDYVDTHEAPHSPKTSDLVWNVLTILVILAAIVVSLFFLTVFSNPNNIINPFPPPVTPTSLLLASATPTSRLVLPPTWTPAPTAEPTPTNTPGPTSTPLVTPFEFATDTPAPEITPGGMSFILQQGSPRALPNLYHPELGCNWMGVGGQAVDLRGAPVVGLIVQLGGSINGILFDNRLSITGTAPQYDRGGFEFTLADRTIASTGKLWLQLLDQAGLPLSEKVYFDTYGDCEKNLIILYFSQVR